MNVFDLFGQIKLDGASAVKKELSETEAHAKKVSDAMKIMGTMFTAVGAAGLKMVSDARQMNAQLGQTALTLGISTKEMRDLALETTNVTFPLESVKNTFDLLTKAGVRNTQELKNSAGAFDALADATGSSAETVADILIPALKAMGETLPQNSADLDKFTWLTKNTTTELSDFGSVMDYVAMYGKDLNVSLDDMIAIMAILEDQGKGGATATRLFRTAVTEAADGTVTLNEALGITPEEIAKYRTEMEGATGITDDYAEVANEQYGIMDKIKQKFSELTLVAGSYLTPLEPILAAMTAMGPAMILLSSATGIQTIKTVAHTVALVAHTVAHGVATAAQWAFNAAVSANPIGLIILAIAALVTGIILLAKNWDFVKEKMLVVWDVIVSIVKGHINLVIGFINGMIWAIEKAINFLGDAIRQLPSITIPDWVPLIGGKEFSWPAPPPIELPRIPLLDTGGLVQGPGVFQVGPGVKEVVRTPSGNKELHVHIGVFAGTETEFRVLVKKIKEVMGEDDRRNAFGQLGEGYFYGRSSI